MRIGGVSSRRRATYSDCGGGPVLKGLLALCRCMDFPLLGVAGAGDAGEALGHCSGVTLGYRHFQISSLPLSSRNRPRHNDVTAVVGHYGDRVNGVEDNPCEGQRCHPPPQGSGSLQPTRGISGICWLVEQAWLTFLSVDGEDECRAELLE